MEDFFEVSADAGTRLAQAFGEGERKPLRVSVVLGPCGGQRLGLSIDRPRPADQTFDVDGFTFLVEQDLVEEAAPFRVDVGRVGYVIYSRLRCGARECGDCLQ